MAVSVGDFTRRYSEVVHVYVLEFSFLGLLLPHSATF